MNQTSIFGFAALVFFLIGLIPTNTRTIFPKFKNSSIHKLIIKGRRDIGLASFFLGVGHAYFVVRHGNFDFGDLQTIKNFLSGIILGISFIIMAITSNQESQKKLGIANWRKLHHWLSYIGLFTLSWHVLAKMSGHYTIFTWLSFVLLTTISLLYSLRKDVEFQCFNPVNPKQKD